MLKDIAKELMPPDLPVTTRYRLIVAAVLFLTIVMVLAGYGVFKSLGYSGFAQAADLKERVDSVTADVAGVKLDVKDIKVTLLERAILDARRLQCQSTTDESERFYAGQVAQMHRQYYELTGLLFGIPACKKITP